MNSEIRKGEKITKAKTNAPQGRVSNAYKPLDNEREYIPGAENESVEESSKASPFTKRIKKGAWVLIAVAVLGIVGFNMTNTSKTVDTNDDATAALESHMSTTLAPGTKLLSEDDNYVGGDLTITHDSNDDETTLYIWDYAAEDGDYVQIFVAGTPLGDPFMIKNEPVTFQIPTVGNVQVIGTRDGGGGITYAVYYAMNHTAYFNGVDEGGKNTYTLVRE